MQNATLDLKNMPAIDTPTSLAELRAVLLQGGRFVHMPATGFLINGLSDIAALAKADGNVIVGNGTTWVAESGSTARASLGITEGSNSNGTYRLIGSTLECWHSLQLTFANVSQLVATWTYPDVFASAPVVQVTLTNRSFTPSPTEMSLLEAGSVGTTTASIRLNRQLGATNFVSGDTAQVSLYAKGTAA